ncbi:MAG TPA: HEPN/Toprim-associated domain-containing protein [Pedobacter sp.]|nr:HEPN/Toprim-associated domain-containing protein [Pedobacter sp.]
MGTMIQLSLGNMQIDWGKNGGYTDHSALFQNSDLAEVPSYYAGEETEDHVNFPDGFKTIIEYHLGLSKPLWQVADRLRLLGYTTKYCEAEFKYFEDFYAFSDEDEKQKASFEQLKNALETMDTSMLSLDTSGHDMHNKAFKIELYKKMGLNHYVDNPEMLENIGNEDDFISCYSLLQLLSRNNSAKNLPVIWDFADHEHAGWAARKDYVKEPDQSKKFLFVTEGSSDSLILKHGLSLLKPHIADLFDFVDMQEGYPFSGTGNLVNFVKGLISIKVQNNVLILFDNDAEGVASYNKCKGMNVPNNMKILKLPDMQEFERFPTIGTTGEHIANINGSGAAIECYLDLKADGLVRWNNYNHLLKTYQGELIEKDIYKKKFLSQKVLMESYNYTKLICVINMMIDHCSKMMEASLINGVKHPEEKY